MSGPASTTPEVTAGPAGWYPASIRTCAWKMSNRRRSCAAGAQLVVCANDLTGELVFSGLFSEGDAPQ